MLKGSLTLEDLLTYLQASRELGCCERHDWAGLKSICAVESKRIVGEKEVLNGDILSARMTADAAEKLPGSSGITGVSKTNCIGYLMFVLTRIPAEREQKMPQKISPVSAESP